MLTDLIDTLTEMSFTEIEDFIDYVKYHHAHKITDDTDAAYKLRKQATSNRAGKPTGGFPDGMLFPDRKPLTMTTDAQRRAHDLFIDLPPDELPIALHTASALKRKIAPLRKASTGTIQVKFIPYERMRMEYNEHGMLAPVFDDTGKPIIDTIAPPYLYLRYWQVYAHDDERNSRYKSVYIGGDASSISDSVNAEYEYPYRALARYFYQQIQQHGVKVSPKNRKPYHRRPRGDDNPISRLEKRILDCIDLDKLDRLQRAGMDTAPAIDHDALSTLQAQLTGSE